MAQTLRLFDDASGGPDTRSHSILNDLDADFPTTVTSYYLDDSTPAVTQCTGDAAAYGSSGSYITSAIPNTGPRIVAAGTFTSTRRAGLYRVVVPADATQAGAESSTLSVRPRG